MKMRLLQQDRVHDRLQDIIVAFRFVSMQNLKLQRVNAIFRMGIFIYRCSLHGYHHGVILAD